MHGISIEAIDYVIVCAFGFQISMKGGCVSLVTVFCYEMFNWNLVIKLHDDEYLDSLVLVCKRCYGGDVARVFDSNANGWVVGSSVGDTQYDALAVRFTIVNPQECGAFIVVYPQCSHFGSLGVCCSCWGWFL